MKTAKSKPRGRLGKQPSSRKDESRKPVDLGEIRREIEDLVGGRAVEMVETTISAAGNGHYAAMKYLFEMIGLYPVTAQAEPSSADSLAQTLLRHLGFPEEARLETKVTKDFPAEPGVDAGDTVK